MLFVSQSRFHDAQRRISELKQDLEKAQAEITRLNSFIAWRLGGAPTHPDIDPRADWMKPGAPPEEKKEVELPDDVVSRAIRDVRSTNPRRVANRISKMNEADYRRAVLSLPSKHAALSKEFVAPSKETRKDILAAAADLENALKGDRPA